MVRSDSFRLSSIRSSPILGGFGQVRFGSVQYDSGGVGQVRFGSVQSGLGMFYRVRFGVVIFGSVRFGSVYSVELSPARLPSRVPAEV